MAAHHQPPEEKRLEDMDLDELKWIWAATSATVRAKGYITSVEIAEHKILGAASEDPYPREEELRLTVVGCIQNLEAIIEEHRED